MGYQLDVHSTATRHAGEGERAEPGVRASAYSVPAPKATRWLAGPGTASPQHWPMTATLLHLPEYKGLLDLRRAPGTERRYGRQLHRSLSLRCLQSQKYAGAGLLCALQRAQKRLGADRLRHDLTLSFQFSPSSSFTYSTSERSCVVHFLPDPSKGMYDLVSFDICTYLVTFMSNSPRSHLPGIWDGQEGSGRSPRCFINTRPLRHGRYDIPMSAVLPI